MVEEKEDENEGSVEVKMSDKWRNVVKIRVKGKKKI